MAEKRNNISDSRKDEIDAVRDLRVGVRRAAVDKPAVEHNYFVTNAASVFRLKTEDGHLTFAGTYFMLLNDIFEERKLAKKTAREYNRIVCKHVLGQFNGPAFKDMTEDDFTEPWNRIVDSDIPYSSLRNASVVVRTMMKLAYQKGMTRTILWGLPERHTKIDNQYQTEPKKEGKRLVKRTINNSRTFSLVAELRFIRINLAHMDTYGEALGAIIMLECGTRTSETTAFSYRDLTKVSDGYYALVRYNISNKESTNISAGGKTMNAFRLIPLPAFLAEILLRRRVKLEELYSKEEVDQLPICCKGNDYTRRCKQSELNEFVKNMYRLAGVREEILADTYYNMHEDAEGAEDSEGYATAYLCRHQFATAMSYCGLTQGEIYILMGHKIEVENVMKSDYSTPSKFQKLANKMDRRPNVYIFNRELGASRGRSMQFNPYEAPEMEIHSDGDVVIPMPRDMNFSLEVLSRKCGVPLSVEKTESCELNDHYFVIPDTEVSEGMSCYMDLVKCAEKAWRKIQDEAIEQLPVEIPVDVDEVVRKIEEKMKAGELDMDIPEDEEPEAKETASVGEMEENVAMEAEAADDLEPEREETEDIAGDEEEEENDEVALTEGMPSEKDEAVEAAEPREEMTQADDPRASNDKTDISGKKAKKKVGRSHYGPSLWVADSAGRISKLDHPTQKQKRNRVGKRIPVCTKKIVPARVFFLDTAHKALMLSPEGMLYKISERTKLDSTKFADENNPACRALKEGAIILQRPEVMEGNGVIVCVANTGQMRKVSLERFQSFPAKGRQMVRLGEGEHIVAACLCREDEDVLIMSEQGRMLRISANTLRAASGVTGLVAGMQMREGDHPAACVAYHDNAEYLAVTERGMAARYDRTVEHIAHGVNTAGRACMKVNEGDRAIALLSSKDALYLVNNDGYWICCDMEEIRPVKGYVQGVIAQALKDQANQRIITALALQIPLSK